MHRDAEFTVQLGKFPVTHLTKFTRLAKREALVLVEKKRYHTPHLLADIIQTKPCLCSKKCRQIEFHVNVVHVFLRRTVTHSYFNRKILQCQTQQPTAQSPRSNRRRINSTSGDSSATARCSSTASGPMRPAAGR